MEVKLKLTNSEPFREKQLVSHSNKKYSVSCRAALLTLLENNRPARYLIYALFRGDDSGAEDESCMGVTSFICDLITLISTPLFMSDAPI